MKRILIVASIVLLLFGMAFWSMGWSLPEKSEAKPTPVKIDYQKELESYYERAVRENGNITPFKTKEVYINSRNLFVVGAIEPDGVKCFEKETFWTSPVYSVSFQDGRTYMINEKLYKYSATSPTGLHIHQNRWNGRDNNWYVGKIIT